MEASVVRFAATVHCTENKGVLNGLRKRAAEAIPHTKMEASVVRFAATVHCTENKGVLNGLRKRAAEAIPHTKMEASVVRRLRYRALHRKAMLWSHGPSKKCVFSILLMDRFRSKNSFKNRAFRQEAIAMRKQAAEAISHTKVEAKAL